MLSIVALYIYYVYPHNRNLAFPFSAFRSLSPMRLSSMDGTAIAGRSYPLQSLSLSRPSASESNLRKLTMGASDPVPRPGSALGCLQGKRVIFIFLSAL